MIGFLPLLSLLLIVKPHVCHDWFLNKDFYKDFYQMGKHNIQAKKVQGCKLFPGWRRSNCPIKPIFARTYPIFGRSNIDYVLLLWKCPLLPSHDVNLNMKQVHFHSIYYTLASISLQEKWKAWYSKSASYHCFSSASYIQLVMKLMTLTEACNLVNLKCYRKQGSYFPKMRDWTFKIQ